MWVGSERSTLCASANEEPDSLVNNAPLTGYEPNFDDNHFSETTEIFIQESSSDTRPSYLHDSEISDHTIGRALSSPLFTHEREEPAGRRHFYHSPEESLLSSQSLSVGHVRTGRPVSDRHSENEQITVLLERQKEQTLADYRAEIQKHEFQADYDRRNIPKLKGVFDSSLNEVKFYRAHQGDEQLRRDQQLLHEQSLEQNRELREAHVKSINEMKKLKLFQGSTFDTIARRKLVEDRDTILLTHKQDSGITD